MVENALDDDAPSVTRNAPKVTMQNTYTHTTHTHIYSAACLIGAAIAEKVQETYTRASQSQVSSLRCVKLPVEIPCSVLLLLLLLLLLTLLLLDRFH